MDGESDLTCRMRSISVERTVKFDERLIVYKLNDWPADVYREARRGQWMQYAADRCRFKRRIRQTELKLGNILVMNIAIELCIVCISYERTSS
jgi:hypothetical protein